MEQKQLELELKKITTQQMQWHEEFTQRLKEDSQRERHWSYQRLVWAVSASVAITAVVIKVFFS